MIVSYVRFFTYLALFSSSMMGLIISPNLLEIYVFWELVGMCSYLLVGFGMTEMVLPMQRKSICC